MYGMISRSIVASTYVLSCAIRQSNVMYGLISHHILASTIAAMLVQETATADQLLVAKRGTKRNIDVHHEVSDRN